MKPRNNRERLVVKLSAKIPAITKAQKEYSIRHCFAHTASSGRKQTPSISASNAETCSRQRWMPSM